MQNLKEETIAILKANGKTIFDIEWFGTEETRIDVDLQEFLDFNYDNGYRDPVVPECLILVGKDFWLERHEYDGSEWWEYKRLPPKPDKVIYDRDWLG